MGSTTPWSLRYPEGSDPVRLSQYFRNLAEDTNAALEDVSSSVAYGGTVVAARLAKTIIPASGSQTVITMSGWASAPAVVLTPEHGTYSYIFTIAGITTTQVNVFLAHHDNTPLPDGWAITLNVIAIGQATAGQVPVLA